MNVLLLDWLVSKWLLDGVKGVIFRVISVWLELGGWNGVIFRVIFPNDDDSRPEVDRPEVDKLEVVSEEPERTVAGLENGLAVCFALRNGLFAGGSTTVVPNLLMVLDLLPNELEVGFTVVVPKTLLDFVSPKLDETFFSTPPGGALSNELFPKTDPLEVETGPDPKVDFDWPISILGCPKIGFSDWLVPIAGGGFPKRTLGCTGGGTEKSPLGGAVESGTEAGREAGFLKIPKVGSEVRDSSLTDVNFDAVKPVKPLFSAFGPPKLCFADVEAF